MYLFYIEIYYNASSKKGEAAMENLKELEVKLGGHFKINIRY